MLKPKYNPVQKNLYKFNKPKSFKDRKNDYQRKEKHPSKRWDSCLEGI